MFAQNSNTAGRTAVLLICILAVILSACSAVTDKHPPATPTAPAQTPDSATAETSPAPATTAAPATTDAVSSETTAEATEPAPAQTGEPARAFINETGTELPDGVARVLEGMLFMLGEAENQYTDFDYTPYFLGGRENESCRYYTARSTYYAGFRRQEFEPVRNLRQTLRVTYCDVGKASVVLTVNHFLSFSYAHIASNSAAGASYDVVLRQSDDSLWQIESMHCLNDWFESEYRNNIEELERLAAEIG